MSNSTSKDEPDNTGSGPVNDHAITHSGRVDTARTATTMGTTGINSEPKGKPKPSILSKMKFLWAKAGIDKRTAKSMFKGSLAPTIALAAYQATAFADYYTTIGYLVIIMTILPIVIMPRAKFLQTMLINILFACVGCSIALLAMYCAVRARIDSTGEERPGQGGPGTSGTAAKGAATAGYNSSASAVAGVWLFVEIYAISVVRAKMPQYNIPCIMWAIFANVSMTYAPQFSTMVQAEAFAQKLITGFLTGFGIAFGVSLLIFPLNSRQVVFKGLSEYIAGLRGALQANLAYMHTLEEQDMFAAQRTNTAGEKPPRSTEAANFKEKMRGLAGMHAKLSTDMPFAKREVAFGKLGPDDIQECFRLFRLVMVPMLGLSCMSDIFDRIAQDRGWDRSVNMAHASLEEAQTDDEKIRIETVNEWHTLMRLLREPFESVTKIIDEGLEHVVITLQLAPKPKSAKNADVESEGSDPRPGDHGFACYFDEKRHEFLKSKEIMLRGWCHLHGIELPENFFDDPDHVDFETPKWMQEGVLSEPHQHLRKQLFLCLYIEFLLISMSRRLYQLILVVDGFRDNGKLQTTRLVVPGLKRLRKWFTSLLNGALDSHGDDDLNTDGSSTAVYLGDAYKRRKDPEHLPPQNGWEHFGNQFRKIAHFFRSPASAFGFRAACATMTLAVINLLHDTQIFFTTQRLFWAQIMVSIAMSPSAGQSLRSFIQRIAGTFFALICSWIAWYIVDGHTAGVIVFFFIFMNLGNYVVLKYPAYIPVGILFQVTMSLIIGYELQVRKIGVNLATSNGQAYYPIYELGPIRLATVSGGLFVAWIWTVFPYPISEHNQMRKNLGSGLYLLANYYSVMHETVRLRIRNEQGDVNVKDSPGRKLEKIRNKLYTKANLTIQGLRAQAGFLKFDIPIGGRFPQEQYQKLINDLQSILNFMSLVSVASYSFTELRQEGEEKHGLKWLAGFQKLVGETNYTSEQVTTLLTLMSASITSGQALPPYLRVPEPYSLAHKADEMNKDILSVRHIAEPGYASFAVIQIGTKLIHDDLKELVAGVKQLVGELDFSYHIVSTADPSRNESEETLVYTKTREGVLEGRTKQE